MKVYNSWAEKRGMAFNPIKSELIHFTRARRLITVRLKILGEDYPGLALKESARFLGVWIDRKLNFKAYVKAVNAKLVIQTLALTRLAGKTWGIRTVRAREIYTKVIRSVLLYAANVWHTLAEVRKGPKGAARKLAV